MAWTLALHTGTIDTAPLDRALTVAHEAGWDAVELRHVDFARAVENGRPIDDALQLVKASGLPVTAVGVERGWIYADGDERRRLLASIAEVGRWAAELNAPIVMSPVDAEPGDLARAVASVREVGDLVAARGKMLALELNIGTVQFRTLEQIRELLARVDHPNVGLLVDTYHIQRGGRGLASYADLAAGEIAYFQYSDVPPGPMDPPGNTFDRLPPGEGVVPFSEILPILTAKGYDGPLSYEALNRANAEHDPLAVATAALAASRRVLG